MKSDHKKSSNNPYFMKKFCRFSLSYHTARHLKSRCQVTLTRPFLAISSCVYKFEMFRGHEFALFIYFRQKFNKKGKFQLLSTVLHMNEHIKLYCKINSNDSYTICDCWHYSRVLIILLSNLPITKYTISFNYRERDRFLNAYDV